MKTILKYPLSATWPSITRLPVLMPAGARILSVQMQSGRPYLWALVDDDAIETPTERALAVYGTGQPIDDDPGHYVGTFQDGVFVWHVFDRTPRETKKTKAAEQ